MTYLVKGIIIDSASGRFPQVASPGAVGHASGVAIEKSSGKCAISAGPHVVSLSGFSRDASGYLRVLGTSGGLPNPTRYCNGLPFDSTGALCTDGTNPIAYVHDGIPFTTNGSVAAS